MASYVHRSTADREPKAPAPNITIYQTNPGHSHEVSRRDLKGSALVYVSALGLKGVFSFEMTTTIGIEHYVPGGDATV